MDLEQYIAGCLNFDVNEYFKRYIATTGTVTMYSKLLSHYASNDIAVNHYAYIFLNRMCTFRLVQDHPAPSRENTVHSISIPTVNSNSSSLSSTSNVAVDGSKQTTATTTVAATATAGEGPKDPYVSSENVLTLAHMFFNLSTLSVFTDILADTHAAKQKVS